MRLPLNVWLVENEHFFVSRTLSQPPMVDLQILQQGTSPQAVKELNHQWKFQIQNSQVRRKSFKVQNFNSSNLFLSFSWIGKSRYKIYLILPNKYSKTCLKQPLKNI